VSLMPHDLEMGPPDPGEAIPHFIFGFNPK
jgi:hypothetical protein